MVDHGRDAHDGRHHQGVRRPDVGGRALHEAAISSTKNPNTVQALVNAFYKTLRWIDKATPEQIADNVPQEYWLGDKALYMAAVKASLQIYSRDGIVSADSQKRSLDFLKQFDKEIAAATIDAGQDLGRPLREEGGGRGEMIAVIPAKRSAERESELGVRMTCSLVSRVRGNDDCCYRRCWCCASATRPRTPARRVRSWSPVWPGYFAQ